MLWQEYIPYIFSNLILAKVYFNDVWFQQQIKYPLVEKVKVFPKIMCSQKYGDLNVSSYLLPTMIFCMYMQLLFYKLWFPPHLKTTLVGNILPHLFPFSNLCESNWVMIWVNYLKHHLVIIEYDHFAKLWKWWCD